MRESDILRVCMLQETIGSEHGQLEYGEVAHYVTMRRSRGMEANAKSRSSCLPELSGVHVFMSSVCVWYGSDGL